MHNPFGHKKLGKPTDLHKEVVRRLLHGPQARESAPISPITREVPARPAKRFGNLPLLDFPNSPTMEQANEDVTTSANGPHAPSPNATSPIPLLQFPNSPGMNGDEQADAGTDAEANQAGENPLQLLANEGAVDGTQSDARTEGESDAPPKRSRSVSNNDADEMMATYPNSPLFFFRFLSGNNDTLKIPRDFDIYHTKGDQKGQPFTFAPNMQLDGFGVRSITSADGQTIHQAGKDADGNVTAEIPFHELKDHLPTEDGSYTIKANWPVDTKGAPSVIVGNASVVIDGELIIKDGKRRFVGRMYLANDTYDFNASDHRPEDAEDAVGLAQWFNELWAGKDNQNGYELQFSPTDDYPVSVQIDQELD